LRQIPCLPKRLARLLKGQEVIAHQPARSRSPPAIHNFPKAAPVGLRKPPANTPFCSPDGKGHLKVTVFPPVRLLRPFPQITLPRSGRQSSAVFDIIGNSALQSIMALSFSWTFVSAMSKGHKFQKFRLSSFSFHFSNCRKSPSTREKPSSCPRVGIAFPCAAGTFVIDG